MKRICKEEIHNEKKQLVQAAIDTLLEQKKNVWSIEQVQHQISLSSELKVQRKLVSNILKDQYDMSYWRIHHACHLANIDRSLVLR